MNRSRGVVVFDNGKPIAATRLSRSLFANDANVSPLENARPLPRWSYYATKMNSLNRTLQFLIETRR